MKTPLNPLTAKYVTQKQIRIEKTMRKHPEHQEMCDRLWEARSDMQKFNSILDEYETMLERSDDG